MLCAVLPAMLRAATCELKRDIMKNCLDASDNGDPFHAETTFLAAFGAVAKETASLVASKGRGGSGAEKAGKESAFLLKLQKFQDVNLARTTVLLKESAQEVTELTANVSNALVDLKPIRKAVDERMGALVNMPNRGPMIVDMKTPNGAYGGGLKHFEKLTSAIAGTGVTAVDGVDLQKCKADAISVRAQARHLVACRSAAVILEKKKASDVAQYFIECKAFRANIPKELKSRLDDLARSAD